MEASAPARIDLAGGTLDLWPLNIVHPGSVTVNVAIDRRAVCRARPASSVFRVLDSGAGWERTASRPMELLEDRHTALVGSILLALEVDRALEIELSSGVSFGSGLGGSSALTVALLGALERWGTRDLSGVNRVDLVRDIETRVLGKPAGVQDYYPALAGGLHRIWLEPGRTRGEALPVDPRLWERHLTLFDSRASHSSGLNNWEIFRGRLEGDESIAMGLDAIRDAAVRMAQAVGASGGPDFPEMGRAMADEWEARRGLAPVVSTPTIERAIATARDAGAWAGKACGAGGGGCVVLLSPAGSTDRVRKALGEVSEGCLLETAVANRGLEVQEA